MHVAMDKLHRSFNDNSMPFRIYKMTHLLSFVFGKKDFGRLLSEISKIHLFSSKMNNIPIQRTKKLLAYDLARQALLLRCILPYIHLFKYMYTSHT